MRPEETPPGHPESEEVAAYLDRTLALADRARVEAHLAECAECRQELVEVSRLLESAPQGEAGRRRAPALAAAAAAAAAVAAVLLLRPAEIPVPRGEVLRSDPPAAVEGVPTIPARAPAEGAAVPGGGLAFAWGGAGDDALYRLTVSDEAGTAHWTGTTADTLLALPAGTTLEPGRAYFWRVDALLPDGRSATTRARRFTTLP
jgi:hypothetical protein